MTSKLSRVGQKKNTAPQHLQVIHSLQFSSRALQFVQVDLDLRREGLVIMEPAFSDSAGRPLVPVSNGLAVSPWSRLCSPYSKAPCFALFLCVDAAEMRSRKPTRKRIISCKCAVLRTHVISSSCLHYPSKHFREKKMRRCLGRKKKKSMLRQTDILSNHHLFIEMVCNCNLLQSRRVKPFRM